MDLHVFFKPTHESLAPEYTTTAVQEFTYFITLYGLPPSQKLNVVELPGDTLPYAWAPEIAGLAGPSITEKTNYRLLADAIAHQWWGVSVSPASKDDWWLSDGFSRYSEAMYVESAAGAAGLEEAVKDMSVGALAYDTVPLSSASKLDIFSTEFQSLATDKGAMILHMLRWVLGEDKYNKTMREFATEFAGKSASTDDFKTIAEKNYGEQLTWFFSQWLDSTGAPEFKVKYTTYRLGGAAATAPNQDKTPGFRVTGEISQDLDLFRMPVDLRIDTDGKTENKRIEVVGTTSPFSVETFGRPRRISLDPDHHVLTNSTDVRLRASILRGQALQQQGDLSGALVEFNKALDLNKNSSLAHYRIAEVFFFQRNYQSSANAYRSSIDGDGEPRWTEVWSRIQLGKIFDITGQRERAINEYRQADADQRQHLRRSRRSPQISAEGVRAAERKTRELAAGTTAIRSVSISAITLLHSLTLSKSCAMRTRVKTVCAGIVAALVAFAPSFEVLDWVLIRYWEWQHEGRKMKLTLWADDRALLLSFCLCAVVFYITVRYLQRYLPTDRRLGPRWLVIGAGVGVVAVYLSIVAHMLMIARRFSP